MDGEEESLHRSGDCATALTENVRACTYASMHTRAYTEEKSADE
jgi:hypothetical protein